MNCDNDISLVYVSNNALQTVLLYKNNLLWSCAMLWSGVCYSAYTTEISDCNLIWMFNCKQFNVMEHLWERFIPVVDCYSGYKRSFNH